LLSTLLFHVRSLKKFHQLRCRWGQATETHENKFSLVSVMSAMLRDSIVVVVVVRTRPRAILLATLTTKKNQFMVSHDAYGAPFHGSSDRGTPLLRGNKGGKGELEASI